MCLCVCVCFLNIRGKQRAWISQFVSHHKYVSFNSIFYEAFENFLHAHRVQGYFHETFKFHFPIFLELSWHVGVQASFLLVCSADEHWSYVSWAAAYAGIQTLCVFSYSGLVGENGDDPVPVGETQGILDPSVLPAESCQDKSDLLQRAACATWAEVISSSCRVSLQAQGPGATRHSP